ncbi:MAG: ISL3 family transposase [Polyangiaceae bacterium]
MRATSLLRVLLGLNQTIVVAFELVAFGLLVQVKPTTWVPRCGGCGRPCARLYDRKLRTWRHLDVLGLRVELQYQRRRVDCRRCGVTAEMVPWAEPGSRYTRPFEEVVAYLVQKTDKTTVASMMGIGWATAGSIIQRVVARLGPKDLLDGLTQIGIDELSYRKHHEYITIVTDHGTGRVVWAAPGKSAETLRQFFRELGAERAAKLEVVTIDMSPAYIEAVREMAPDARLVFDRFHVQRLAHDALDEVRRAQVRELAGTPEASVVKKTRYALQKNPWNVTQPESERLSEVQRRNRPLYRAYLLKETLAAILDGRQVNVARSRLLEWSSWATHSRLEPFKKVAKTVVKHVEGIVGYVATGLSNGRVEGMNGKVRVLTRRAYGFHSAASLIAMLFLCCSGITLSPLHRTLGGASPSARSLLR